MANMTSCVDSLWRVCDKASYADQELRDARFRYKSTLSEAEILDLAKEAAREVQRNATESQHTVRQHVN
jgi:hypothetical protein